MAQVIKEAAGVFLGKTLVQQSGNIGGAKHVFVRFDDNYGDLVPLPFGGQVMNPFKGAGRFYAGDLIDMEYDERTESPKLYLLKTYEVLSSSGKTVNIKRDGYRHIPYAGDILMIAPDEIGGSGEALTVTAVSKTTVSGTDVWALTLSKTPTTAPAEGDILTEADKDGNMLVKNINAVAPCDYDFLFNPAATAGDEEDFEGARYFFTPAAGGTMYAYKMSPIPECVKKLNIANYNGWFRVDARNKPAVLQVKETAAAATTTEAAG